MISFWAAFKKICKGYVSLEILPVVVFLGERGDTYFTVGQGLRAVGRKRCPGCLWDCFSAPQSWQASREPLQALLGMSALLSSQFLEL